MRKWDEIFARLQENYRFIQNVTNSVLINLNFNRVINKIIFPILLH